MNNPKPITVLVFVRLLIPLLVVLLLTPLACNLPISTGEPTASPSSIQQPTSIETATLPTEAIITEPVVSPTALQTEPVSGEIANFSMAGPWVILPAQDRLWAANIDGSYSLPLVNQASLSWFVQKVAVAPQGGYLAFTASWEEDSLSHLTLFVAKLPEMTVEMVGELTTAETEPSPDAAVCDASFEAVRAMVIGNSMAWSPDGRQLAFIGAQAGLTADVFVYSVDNAETTRVSEEPSQAYDLAWSPDGENIVFFSADCFGTGAGFSMAGAWTASPAGLNARELYEIAPESTGEHIVGWRGNRDVVVDSSLFCSGQNLRSINLDSGVEKVIFDGCSSDSVMTEDGTIALIISPDMAADGQNGLYIFPADGSTAIHNPDLPGYQIAYFDGYGSFFIIDTNFQAVEVDFSGKPGMVMYLPEMPIFSPGGKWWASLLGEDLLVGNEPLTGETIFSGTISNIIWTEDPATGNETLFFLGGTSNKSMEFYAASPPDFTVRSVNGITVIGGSAESQVLNP